MSQEELVGAYLDGRISRRTLIRRLVGAGISVGAAVSYAQVLKPERAFARADSDHYPDTSVKLVDEDLDKVITEDRFKVRVRADEDAELEPLVIRCYLKDGLNFYKVAERQFDFIGPEDKKVKVPLEPGAGTKLFLPRAKILLFWTGYDRQGKLPNGSDTHVFKP